MWSLHRFCALSHRGVAALCTHLTYCGLTSGHCGCGPCSRSPSSSDFSSIDTSPYFLFLLVPQFPHSDDQVLADFFFISSSAVQFTGRPSAYLIQSRNTCQGLCLLMETTPTQRCCALAYPVQILTKCSMSSYCLR